MEIHLIYFHYLVETTHCPLDIDYFVFNYKGITYIQICVCLTLRQLACAQPGIVWSPTPTDSSMYS